MAEPLKKESDRRIAQNEQHADRPMILIEILPLWEHRRQACGKGKDVDAQPLQVHQRIASNINGP